MEIFRINENEQSQFVRIPEVAMDLNFGQSTAKFYMVVSCRIAILLDENTFTESEDSYFRLPEGTNVPPEARTRDFMRWFDSLPLVPTIETATPQQAWESFAGAIGPVTPSGAFPVPPPPPRPPSIYGHLPFKATTLADTVIYRWEAYPISRRINIHANPPNVAKDTYAAPALEVPFAQTGFAAVARFALPNLMPACYRYELQPLPGTPIECGAAVPLYGQSGGGVEVKFVAQTTNRGAIANPIVLPPL